MFGQVLGWAAVGTVLLFAIAALVFIVRYEFNKGRQP